MKQSDDKMEIDPICGMEVSREKALKLKHNGKTYYFCSEGCRDIFIKQKKCSLRESYDFIIVGGGPAGLTAAVFAANLKINALLITKDMGGQAADSTKIQNYMGYNVITGPELIEKFKYQLIHSNFIDHSMSEVEKIEPVDEGFRIIAPDCNNHIGKALLIATGMTKRKLNIDGEEKFKDNGIYYGNIKDLSFLKGKEVAVIGGGNSALQKVETLQKTAKRIYLISDFDLIADSRIIAHIDKLKHLEKFIGYKPIKFSGNGSLNELTIRKMAEDKEINLFVDAVFVEIGFRPNSFLVSSLVKLNKKGEIIINPDCSTSFPGIFAAGDVTDVFGKRIIIASGEGAKAAIAARKYIRKESNKLTRP
jgi:alkyl hydroperoxide reductase subunit F